jgi:glycosyltransferase involved in cell wall biosynthesis
MNKGFNSNKIESSSKKLKVLVSAYACEPDKGSEPGVGWNWVKQIARLHEVWVITRANNRRSIDRELKLRPDRNLHFLFTDLPSWLRFWKRGARGVRFYYYLWQFWALGKAFTAHGKIHFDLSHHLTFVNNWLPALVALLPVPFIWGPVGSNSPLPRPFLESERSRIKEWIRLAIQSIFRCLDPLFYLTLLRARKIIMINTNIAGRYPFSLISKEKIMIKPAIGLQLKEETWLKEKNDNLTRVISVGQLIYLKGFHLGIEAFSRALESNQEMELLVLGDGRERDKLGNLVKKLGIDKKVRLVGRVPRDEVMENLVKSDIFLFPSFEGGGMAVLEAMGAGLPVICLDWGGPGEMVTDDCGIKIRPQAPPQTIQDLAEAILKLSDSPELRNKMGEAGRKRVKRSFSWDRKGEVIERLYPELARSRSEK